MLLLLLFRFNFCYSDFFCVLTTYSPFWEFIKSLRLPMICNRIIYLLFKGDMWLFQTSLPEESMCESISLWNSPDLSSLNFEERLPIFSRHQVNGCLSFPSTMDLLDSSSVTDYPPNYMGSWCNGTTQPDSRLYGTICVLLVKFIHHVVMYYS